MRASSRPPWLRRRSSSVRPPRKLPETRPTASRLPGLSGARVSSRRTTKCGHRRQLQQPDQRDHDHQHAVSRDARPAGAIAGRPAGKVAADPPTERSSRSTRGKRHVRHRRSSGPSVRPAGIGTMSHVTASGRRSWPASPWRHPGSSRSSRPSFAPWPRAIRWTWRIPSQAGVGFRDGPRRPVRGEPAISASRPACWCGSARSTPGRSPSWSASGSAALGRSS